MKFLFQRDYISFAEKNAVYLSTLSDSTILYCKLDEISTIKIDIDWCPVGTVQFVQAVMNHNNIEIPDHMTYPECLRPWLDRVVWVGQLHESKPDIFVKPFADIKLFTGALFQDLENVEQLDPMTLVYFSEPVKFISEWRFYVLNNECVGASRYDDGESDDAEPPNLVDVGHAINKMAESESCPAGYALDFGVLEDGRTVLIEANDGWALGYYKHGSGWILPCSFKGYAELLHARWQQIIQPYLL